MANQGQWALRLQGGTPTDPVLAQKFFESVPGDPKYAFGALRCGNDNNYGDNVEGISFPGSIKHIFCYEYLVIPPPTSGTITIQKQVSGAPAGDNPYFPFNGNISYDVNGFQLANGGSMVFYRAGSQTWSVTEGAVANYRLDRIDCTSATRTSTFTVSGSTAHIHLAAGDHATCVYHNAYVPPPGGLTIRKVTRGGVGTFSYTVTASPTPGEVHRAQATTTQPRVPVDAVPSLLNLAPGQLRDRRAEANVARRALAPAPRELQRREPIDDQAVRRRDPQRPVSRLHVRQQLRSARLDLDREDHRGWRWHRLLRGHAGDGAADAAPPERDHDKPGGGGRGQAADPRRRHRQPSPRHLSHRRTAAPQLHRRLGPDHGRVQRSGDPLRPGDGDHQLTRKVPDVHCVFTNAFSATPPVPPNPTPVPPMPPHPLTPDPAYDIADLIVTKVASATVVTRGQVIGFRITVKNRGPDPAQRVVLDDQPRAAATVVEVHTTVGGCHHSGRLTVCPLGTLKRGASVTITVRTRVHTHAASFVNRAVVGTSTLEQTLANNIASARVTVVGPPRPVVGCPSSVRAQRTTARIAC